MKKHSIYLLPILILILFSCESLKPKKTSKRGLNYIIPMDMEESPLEAKRFNYDNLLVKKNTKYSESDILIAIRHNKNNISRDLNSYAKNDQFFLQNRYDIEYEDDWAPVGFKEKKINYASYQFSYSYNDEVIYQRSVYIKHEASFYIISMSSKYKNIISDKINDFFWENIFFE